MPRSRPIREPCECRDCLEPGPPPLSIQAAIARQDPPPKSLIILLHNAIENLGCFAQETRTDFPHLAAMVRDGSSGFLTSDLACYGLSDSVEILLGDSITNEMSCTPLKRRFHDLQSKAVTDDKAVEVLCQATCARTSTSVVMEGTRRGNQLSWKEPREVATCVASHLGIPFLKLPTADLDGFGLDLLTPMAPNPPDSGTLPPTSQPKATGTLEDAQHDIDMLLLLLDASPPHFTSAAASLGGHPHSAVPQAVDAAGSGQQSLDTPAVPSMPLGAQHAHHASTQLPGTHQPSGNNGSSSSSGSEGVVGEGEWCECVLQWLDSLLMHLNRVEGFRDTVLLTVVLGMQPRVAASLTAQHVQRGQGPMLGTSATRDSDHPQQQEQQLHRHHQQQQRRQEQQQEEEKGGQERIPGYASRLQAANGGPEQASPPGQQQGGQSVGVGSPPRWPFRRPLQSYQFRGEQRVEPHPESLSLVVHRLPGVIRRDAVQVLSLQEVQRVGGGGCILADRLLPELAYKLGRAPKYGA